MFIHEGDADAGNVLKPAGCGWCAKSSTRCTARAQAGEPCGSDPLTLAYMCREAAFWCRLTTKIGITPGAGVLPSIL